MATRVLLVTTDLWFRAKLAGVLGAAGATLTRDEAACDVAVVELETPDALARIGRLRGRGVPVVAFGAHVSAELLRAARDAGAVAVPNSRVEERVRELLGRA